MVKKAKWLKNVKKAFSGPDLKKLKYQSDECKDTVISYPVLVATSRSSPPQFEVRVDEVKYDQKNKNLSPASSDSVTATDEEDAAVDSSPSSPESVHRAVVDRFAGMSEEDAAAILIQITFKGYLVRRELRVTRGVARLESFMEGSVVKRQAANTLKCMHTLSRLQLEIRSRRIIMAEENQARHKQLLQKHAKELGGLKNGGNWNFSNQSKEQVEASMLHRYEATMRRERGLAYAFTHQQTLKSNSKSTNSMFVDPSNLTWGWSYFERWMAGQPWESSETEQTNNIQENSAAKTSTSRKSNGGNKTTKPSNRNKLNSSTQPNTTSSSSSSSTTAKIPRKNRPVPPSIRPKTTENNRRPNITRTAVSDDESLASSTTRRTNRVPKASAVSDDESLASSTTRRTNRVPKASAVSDDESLASSTTRRTNRVPIGSARAKLKAPSSSGTNTEENGVVHVKAPAKKRLSSSASPAPKPRRSSAPPKVENIVLKAEKMP